MKYIGNKESQISGALGDDYADALPDVLPAVYRALSYGVSERAVCMFTRYAVSIVGAQASLDEEAELAARSEASALFDVELYRKQGALVLRAFYLEVGESLMRSERVTICNEIDEDDGHPSTPFTLFDSAAEASIYNELRQDFWDGSLDAGAEDYYVCGQYIE